MKIAIVGAGISGLTTYWLLKQINKEFNIDIFEKRDKIGGNCSDALTNEFYKQDYGPHIFHTDKRYIWNFLNQFSKFNTYKHKVFSYIDNELKSFPIIFSELPDEIKTSKNFIYYINNKLSLKTFKNAEEYLYSILGKKYSDLYFKFYSEKQWGLQLNEIPAEVVQRIPIKIDNNIFYFPNNKFQGIPKCGFQKLFENMNIDNIIYDNAKYIDLKNYTYVILTGSPDSFFNFTEGKLNYRYIKFKFKKKKKQYQQNSVINYPNNYKFTRITEFNHFLPGKKFNNSILCFEYPTAKEKFIPCYPIFWHSQSQKNLINYQKRYPAIIFLGRLAEFKYMNMDDAVNNVFVKLKSFFPKEINNIINKLDNVKKS
jgi:UDP-galactopyranose mutase